MIRAVIFDLDGTLSDTEVCTDQSITSVMAGHGWPGLRVPGRDIHGRTWADIVEHLLEHYPSQVSPAQLEAELEACWSALTAKAGPIPGAAQAVQAAAEIMKLGLVSSSPRHLIDALLSRIGVSAQIPPPFRISGAELSAPKPDPEGFLLMAKRLETPPSECLVVEDSVAGLSAAKAAGMLRLAILGAPDETEQTRSLADASIKNYLALPPDFWKQLFAQTETSLSELLG